MNCEKTNKAQQESKTENEELYGFPQLRPTRHNTAQHDTNQKNDKSQHQNHQQGAANNKQQE